MLTKVAVFPVVTLFISEPNYLDCSTEYFYLPSLNRAKKQQMEIRLLHNLTNIRKTKCSCTSMMINLVTFCFILDSPNF